MRSLLKIIRRYSLTAGLVIFIIIFCNVCIFLGVGSMTILNTEELTFGRDSMEQVGEELLEVEEGIVLSEKGQKILENTDFIWAMALDGEGHAVWEWRLPDEVPRRVTLQDVAVFSRWYLEDYPVRTWKSGEFLLVFGCDKERIARYDMLMSLDMFHFLPVYLKVTAIANVLIILLFIFGFGFRFYQSMKPIVEGIEKLALGEQTDIRQGGFMDELAEKLNFVSAKLKQQQEELQRRDEARTDWIAGVSHDIRTPLSLIVGYSDKLADDSMLSSENRRIARDLNRQSLIIRRLIADLNLTSKLAYQAQPLKITIGSPAALLRECVADIYNGRLDEDTENRDAMPEFTVDIATEEEVEKARVLMDEGLIRRALRNLVGNSIRHNEEGCHVTVYLSDEGGQIRWRIEDTGCGIPEIVVQNMERHDNSVHIMGLRIVAQIAEAHGGRLTFRKRPGGSYDAEFSIDGRYSASGKGR